MEFPFIVVNLFSQLDMNIQLIGIIELYRARVNFKFLNCDKLFNLINPIIDCFRPVIRSCSERQ